MKVVKNTMRNDELAAISLLKQLITKKRVLKIFNQQHESELHNDVSIESFGEVLLKKSPDHNLFHPVYYMSKKMKQKENTRVIS